MSLSTDAHPETHRVGRGSLDRVHRHAPNGLAAADQPHRFPFYVSISDIERDAKANTRPKGLRPESLRSTHGSPACGTALHARPRRRSAQRSSRERDPDRSFRFGLVHREQHCGRRERPRDHELGSAPRNRRCAVLHRREPGRRRDPSDEGSGVLVDPCCHAARRDRSHDARGGRGS